MSPINNKYQKVIQAHAASFLEVFNLAFSVNFNGKLLRRIRSEN